MMNISVHSGRLFRAIALAPWIILSCAPLQGWARTVNSPDPEAIAAIDGLLVNIRAEIDRVLTSPGEPADICKDIEAIPIDQRVGSQKLGCWTGVYHSTGPTDSHGDPIGGNRRWTHTAGVYMKRWFGS